jgi:hypothetical protein
MFFWVIAVLGVLVVWRSFGGCTCWFAAGFSSEPLAKGRYGLPRKARTADWTSGRAFDTPRMRRRRVCRVSWYWLLSFELARPSRIADRRLQHYLDSGELPRRYLLGR